MLSFHLTLDQPWPVNLNHHLYLQHSFKSLTPNLHEQARLNLLHSHSLTHPSPLPLRLIPPVENIPTYKTIPPLNEIPLPHLQLSSKAGNTISSSKIPPTPSLLSQSTTPYKHSGHPSCLIFYHTNQSLIPSIHPSPKIHVVLSVAFPSPTFLAPRNPSPRDRNSASASFSLQETLTLALLHPPPLHLQNNEFTKLF